MRDETIAVMADVHGNATALAAVLADAKRHQATRYWFLGDLFLPGPSTQRLLTMLDAVQPEVWLNGNWELDMYAIMAGHFRLSNSSEVYVARLTAYALDHVDEATWARLKQHPIATTVTVNGLTLALSHNEVHRAGGRNLYPAQPQANFDQFVAPEADVAVYGHTHQQLMRPTTSGQLVINPGATGQPYSPWQHFFADQRAHYALLHIDQAGRLDVEFRKVSYDIQAELALAASDQVPYLELYQHLRETGSTSTHNLPLLAQVNAAHDYVQAVATYYRKPLP